VTDFSPIVGRQLIGCQWVSGGGAESTSLSPVDGRETWRGCWADAQQAVDAVTAAQAAFDNWSLRDLQERSDICRAFAKHVESRRNHLADLIAWETGKPRWEALTEVTTVIAKVDNSIDAQKARRWTTVERQSDLTAVTRYRPHGVMLVLGPFNFPAHLPGGHIVPALLAGNTIVFKPSELTPAVGQWLAEAWQAAGLPSGVLNLLHGDATIARQLASDDRVAGVLFTGSYRAGASLHELLAGKPEKVLALEMGGNNPLVVHNASNLASAVLQIVESAYITSGQRCTCARRLIITESSQPEKLLALLASAIQNIRVGLPFDQPQPFMGTLIRPAAARRMLDAQTSLLDRGGRAIVAMQLRPHNSALLTPGLLDVTDGQLEDEEHFGPLLCALRVPSFDAALAAANATRFGLAAGLLADSAEDYHYFSDRVRAGIVNWNRQTTGASGRLPFGGIGSSGNHAPSGYFAADYCAYPVASLESQRLPEVSAKVLPGLEEAVQSCSSS
jgi:succinylglutamic semialdehyde dehydrogenase